MKILVFDTETTWFINKKDPHLDKQPHIIQFAWILWEIDDKKTFKEIERRDIFFKPPISIPYDASQVHHIYDVDVQDKQAIHEHIDELMAFISHADIIVWHNIEYDEMMLDVELRRLGKKHLYNPSQVVCTMKETVDYCALIGNGERYKYPKLWELYKKLFWEYFIGAHDAMTDVEATLKCFIELYRQDILKLKENNNQVISLF